METLDSKVTEKQNSLGQLNDDVSRTKARIVSLAEEEVSIQRRIDSLLNVEKQHEVSIEINNMKVADVTDTLAEVTAQVGEAEKNKELLEKEIKVLESKKGNVLGDIVRFETDKGKAEKSLEVARIEGDTFVEKSNKTKEELNTQEQQLKSEVVVLRESHKKLDAELVAKQAELKAFNAEMQTRTNDIQQRELELEKQGRLLNNAKSELKKQWRKLQNKETKKDVDEFFTA